VHLFSLLGKIIHNPQGPRLEPGKPAWRNVLITKSLLIAWAMVFNGIKIANYGYVAS
jgi:hypothetical protein